MVVVKIRTTQGIVIEGRQTLFPTDEYRLQNNYRAYDFDPKNRRFLMIRGSDAGPLVLVQNLFENLER